MMALEIYMIGVITHDMNKSLEFYRRLGLAIPEDSEGKTHVEVKMNGGMTFFLDSRPTRWDPNFPRSDESAPEKNANNYPFLLEFYLKERDALESKYEALTGWGYQGFRTPYQTSFGVYFAMVKDPDGNVILLSAD